MRLLLFFISTIFFVELNFMSNEVNDNQTDTTFKTNFFPSDNQTDTTFKTIFFPSDNQTDTTFKTNFFPADNQTDSSSQMKIGFETSLDPDNIYHNKTNKTDKLIVETNRTKLISPITYHNFTDKVVNGFDLMKMFNIQENSIYVGCVYDPILIDMRFSFKFSFNEHPNKCYDECFKRGYQYAATRKLNSDQNLCFCDDRYGTYENDIIPGSRKCDCPCGISLLINCGCAPFNRVVKVKNRFINTELDANSLGCFLKISEIYINSIISSQKICSETCSSKSYFSAINKIGFCFCGEQILPSLSYRIPNSYCDFNCIEKCYSFFMKVTRIDSRSLEIKCPKRVLVNQVIVCEIIAFSNIESYSIIIDLGIENDKIILNGTNQFREEISFDYDKEGTYSINVFLSDHQMNVQSEINVYDANSSRSNTINKKDFYIHEIATLSGCFYDKEYFKETNTELHSINSLNMTPEYCISYCQKTNFSYAILKSSHLCFCSNKYGMNGLTPSSCNCLCSGSSDKYCGCINNYLAYKLNNKRFDFTIVGSYLGCFTANIFPIGKRIPYNTNGICLNFCSKSNYMFTYGSEYCYCLDTIELFNNKSENMCNLPCPGNSTQICGGFEHASLYEISNISLTANVPYYVQAEEKFNFELILQSSYNASYVYLVDFGDGDIRNISNFNGTLSLEKNYNLNGLYEIRVTFLENNYLVLNPLIFVDELISNYSFEQSNLSQYENIVNPIKIEINENAEYSGCFLRTSVAISISTPVIDNSKCSIYCSKRSKIFSYAHTAGSCHCVNDYNTIVPESLSKCLCACANTLSRFCSCNEGVRMYKDSNNLAQITIGQYLGCFINTNSINVSNEIITNFGFLSNDICIQYCSFKDYLYASTTRGDECICSNETFKLSILNEDYCQQKCSGNRSQICGDIPSKSVYLLNIITMNLDCISKVRQYDEFKCFLKLKSNLLLDSYEILVDFDDRDLRKYGNITYLGPVYLIINKTYEKVGIFTVRAYLIGTSMNVYTKIEVEFVFNENEADLNGFIGCYFDRNPFEFKDLTFVSENNMTNYECMSICNMYGYNFSATFYGNSCSCANKYGSYNSAGNGLSCNQNCSGKKSEICGGETYKSHTIYDSNPSSITFNLKVECTTVNVSSLIGDTYRINPITTCSSKGFPYTIASNNLFYCSNINYSNFGLDETIAFCDNTCPFFQECGSSNYRLNSVYDTRVLKNATFNSEYYDLEYSGCFSIEKPSNYISFISLTISNCYKFCSYYNYSIAGVGLLCICLKEKPILNKASDNYCLNFGNEKYYGIYKLKDQSTIFGDSTFQNMISTLEKFISTSENKISTSENMISTLEKFISTSEKVILTSPNVISTSGNLITSSKINSLTSESESIVNFISLDDLMFKKNKLVIDALNDPTQDLTGCLVNCSHRGRCNLVKEKYKCECLNEYEGSMCELNTNICKKNKQCLYDGVCIPLDNNESFKCECQYPYYGPHCEFEINLCADFKCSNNGVCQVNETKIPYCKCFTYFKGEQCEETETILKNISTFISISSFIAIGIICFAFLLIIFNDGLNIFNSIKNKKLLKKKKPKNKIIIKRFRYLTGK